MTNATARKFGYPESLIAEAGAWLVLVRPQQVTFGSLVLVCTEPATAFGALSGAAFADLGRAVAGVERLLGQVVHYERINYLMLMMVDPDVHFHVIPRYADTRDYAGLTFADAGWPGPPALGAATELDAERLARLAGDLRGRWTQPG